MDLRSLIPFRRREPRVQRAPLHTWRVPGRSVIAGIVGGAFAVGILAGAITTFVPRLVANPDASASPSHAPIPTPTGTGGIDDFPPIDRELDTSDLLVGLESLAIPSIGPGTFTIVPGDIQPTGAGPTRWVRIEIEDTVPVGPEAFGTYVMSVLNNELGWGANGRMTFGKTTGTADIRLLIATPATSAAICSDPHAAATLLVVEPEGGAAAKLSAGVGATPTPSSSGPEPSPSSSPVLACASQGMLVINAYEWAAGLEGFGDDRAAARQYLINHPLGHILGYEDAQCQAETATTGELADVMVNHEQDVSPCAPNAWPVRPDPA